MPIRVESTPPARIPAWRRLGIQLDSEIPGIEAYRRIHEGRQFQASTKVEGLQPSSFNKTSSDLGTTTETNLTPKSRKFRKRKIDGPSIEDQNGQDAHLNGSETPQKRKKSVTFTPDTKETDGDGRQRLLKEWANKQNGGDGEFSKQKASEFLPATKPKSDIAKRTKSPKRNKSKESKAKKVEKQKERENPDDEKPTYLDYVVQYQTNRSTWKFNKRQQSKLLQNVFDVSRIPESYDYAVFPYLSGLQGESIRARLIEEATQVLNTSTNEGAKNDRDDEDDDTLKRGRKRAEAILRVLSSDEMRAAQNGALRSAPQERRDGHWPPPHERHGDRALKKRNGKHGDKTLRKRTRS